MNELLKYPELANILNVLHQRTHGLNAWIETEEEQPLIYIAAVGDDIIQHKDADHRRSLFIEQMSVAPFLFYRFNNDSQIWNIVEEDFGLFGVTQAWQEENSYPNPGVMKAWLNTL